PTNTPADSVSRRCRPAPGSRLLAPGSVSVLDLADRVLDGLDEVLVLLAALALGQGLDGLDGGLVLRRRDLAQGGDDVALEAVGGRAFLVALVLAAHLIDERWNSGLGVGTDPGQAEDRGAAHAHVPVVVLQRGDQGADAGGADLAQCQGSGLLNLL